MRKLKDDDVVLTWKDGTIDIYDAEEYAKIQREHGCELPYGSIKATLGLAYKQEIRQCLKEGKM